MKYIKYADYNGEALAEDECILMSKKEFDNGGKELKGVPVAITPDGEELQESEINNIESLQ